MTLYAPLIKEARAVLKDLILRATEEPEMKVFKNIAAVYVVWQHELHSLELEEMSWKLSRDL